VEGPGQQLCYELTFLGVTSESDYPFAMLPFDGILGLGLAGLATTPQFNFMSQLKKPILAFFLADPNLDEDSEVSFEEWKPNRYYGTLKWVPLINMDTGYWQVNLVDVFLGSAQGKSVGLCKGELDDGGKCRATLDTGSSLTMGSASEIKALTRALDVRGDCTNYDALPDLVFRVEGYDGNMVDLTLSKNEYVDKSDSGCGPLLHPLELPPGMPPMLILGQSFFLKYYTVFDAEKKRVGMAVAKHASARKQTTTPEPPPTAAPVVCDDKDSAMESSQLPPCPKFKSYGGCAKWPSLATSHCAKSCDMCAKARGSGIVIQHMERTRMGVGDDTEI